MKTKQNLWMRIVCWILAILMLLSVSTYAIYAILGLL